LTANPEYGGQGLPHVVGAAVNEQWAAANMSFGLCPELTVGAVMALDAHGSDELKAKWLEPLITGLKARGLCFATLRDHPTLGAAARREVPR
jgi:alkylation response protein AidB-like acyl-CoA dehydrogenase